MGSVTGPHIAGTGDDNTLHTRPKKKVKKRKTLMSIHTIHNKINLVTNCTSYSQSI